MENHAQRVEDAQRTIAEFEEPIYRVNSLLKNTSLQSDGVAPAWPVQKIKGLKQKTHWRSQWHTFSRVAHFLTGCLLTADAAFCDSKGDEVNSRLAQNANGPVRGPAGIIQRMQQLGPLLAAIMLGVPAMALEPSTEALRSIKGAAGAAEARAAVKSLVEGGADSLIPVLQGFQGATPLGANWLRSAFETIAEAEARAGRDLPTDQLIKFIEDTQNAPAARRLAYEWLLKQDESLEARLIPGLLQDAHPAFRRDAAALLIAKAEAAEGAEATRLYREALKGAVDNDQVTAIADALKEAGDPVDLQKHFGFLSDWKIVGPFDNKDMKGYAVAYPPEQEQDLEATYEGQLGDVRWQDISTDDGYGIVDIAEQIENYKGSLMYAMTTYRSSADQNVEFRLGTPNAWKLWVNGELVFEREEYHRSTRMDQYRIPVALQAGENSILLKVCQNEQEEDWAQDYQYQLRVSDSSGAAIAAAGESNE